MRAAKEIAQKEDSSRNDHPGWSELLVDAITKPGVISKAYSQFWNYSTGNQLLAMFQCFARGLAVGPIHTFGGWLELGRHVKKGERALTLCMPVSVKRNAKHVNDPNDSETIAEGSATKPKRSTRFVYRNHWFVLAQTDGKEYEPVLLPAWNEKLALAALKIEHVSFEHTDGNCQGYARDRNIAVSPIAFMPHRTLFHELAHVVLGHTQELSEGAIDGAEAVPKDLREVEAECVAMICSESLALSGVDFSRGYIQHWIRGQAIPDRSAQKIFRAADEILRGGRPVGAAHSDE